jgi:hypothetical protein
MAAPLSAQSLPAQTPNNSAAIATVEGEVEGLYDSLGKPITGSLQALFAYVTPSWRYLFGTFVKRSSSVPATYTSNAEATYNQAQIQDLIDQVSALSKAVGQS